ncbi:MAG: DUF1285 domain-containing protein [Pseudomonadota bacterium]
MEGRAADSNRIQGLSELISAQSNGKRPPVDDWDPPYCGNIGLAIRADGTWYYKDSPIRRDGLVKLFASVLRCDPDGRHYLVTPVEKYDVAVEDAPFLAVEMQVDGDETRQELTFRTNVDDIVRCGPQNPIKFVEQPGSGGLKPYVAVRGRLEALVTRAIYYDLVELAVPDAHDDERLNLWSGGQQFPLVSQ